MGKNESKTVSWGVASRIKLIICGLAFAACTAMPASAGMPLAEGRGLAPKAFYNFCKRDPGNCNSTKGAKIVKMTPELHKQLTAVNSAVNKRMREVSDRQARGVDDDWRMGVSAGDCEDFAIAKKNALVKQGWPASALLLTVARARFSPEGHTVLTVRTSNGDLILDSRSRSVKDWKRTPYRYYARQSQQATGKWDLITR